MNDEEFAVLIELPGERRNLEFKSPGLISDKHFINLVARAVLGMTNRLDGGYVVVGVVDNGGVPNPVGFADARDIAAWTRDTLADKVAPLVDPSVDFDLEHRSYQGRQFVLITVREFDETPVLCRTTKQAPNNGDQVLREGALYVRSRRKPETVEVRTSQEMRDLLDLALQKRLRSFVRLAQAAGLDAEGASPSDDEKFAAQLADLGL